MHSTYLDNDDYITDSIRGLFIDLDYFLSNTIVDHVDEFERTAYKKKFKNAKMKLIAIDSIIRKIRVGEIEIKQLKEMLQGTEEAQNATYKNLIRQLDLLTKPPARGMSHKDMQLAIETMHVPEEEKQILLWNKRKELDTLRKETHTLIKIMFGKSVTTEDSDLLRKEYQKIKPNIKPPMSGFNIYM